MKNEEEKLCQHIGISIERKHQIDETIKETHIRYINGEIKTRSLADFKKKQEVRRKELECLEEERRTQCNTIVFTQSEYSELEYDQSDDREILYSPELIKMQGLEAYPVTSLLSVGITDEFKKELKAAGDFEQFYGVTENDGRYKVINLNRPLYYSIKIKGSFIGYIGFNGDSDALEPEIYIFKQYRNKGYGTIVLKKFIELAFTDGLLRTWKEKNIDAEYYGYIWKNELVHPSKIISTVRVENIHSQKMMFACGFHEINEMATIVIPYLNDEVKTKIGLLAVKEYELTKEEYRGIL